MGAVVDTALRVYGVRGLRVSDASIFPVIPNGNTQAATFMVAERAASLILAAAKRNQTLGNSVDSCQT